jgi:pyrimidine-nucleoside phosphorylase
MIVSEIIRKKREGLELSQDEIDFIVSGAAKENIPDYQLSAWLMSVFFQSMSEKETLFLTQAMKNSGESYHWKKINPKLKNYALVDKHSTGGVGDKVSLIIVPLAIELGIKVPMMSGRGLGHTGGTVDKLLSIPGFKMDLAPEKAAHLLEEVGACMLSQTDKLCPADKKLYHLRDVTATVESYPLITASIVSKKWAEGCEAIVFDVKFGEGAFMETKEKAETLAQWLIKESKLAGLKAKGLLTRMEEPLGTCIGNALEVEESVWILKNEYPSALHKELAHDLQKLCCQTAAQMAILGGTRSDFDKTVKECEEILASGKAYSHFDKLVCAQGGKDHWWKELPRAKTIEVKSNDEGFLTDIQARNLGLLGLEIGIGRKKMDDKINPSSGIEILSGVGTQIKKGDLLARIRCNDDLDKKFLNKILECFVIENKYPAKKGDLLWKILH